MQQRARQFWLVFFDNRAAVTPCLNSKVRAVSPQGFKALTGASTAGCQGADNTEAANGLRAPKWAKPELIKGLNLPGRSTPGARQITHEARQYATARPKAMAAVQWLWSFSCSQTLINDW